MLVNGKTKAYWPPAVKKARTVENFFGGKTIIAKHEKNIDAVRLFEKKTNGMTDWINPLGAFQHRIV